jgi:hypothetical protein
MHITARMYAQKTLARVHCDLFFGMDSASAEHGDGDLYPGFCSGREWQGKAGFSIKVAV